MIDPFLCVFFLLSLPIKSSSVSVVFDFNASLNDVAPVSLSMLSVVTMKLKISELLMVVFCVFFCLHLAD